MNEYTEFDLDRSTAQAWAEFRTRLSEVVSVIDDTADLTIGTATATDDPGPFVRFSSPQRDRVRCEAASNGVLDEDHQLGPGQLEAMEQLGWRPPSAEGEQAGPNFTYEADQERSDAIAELAVTTLRDVYGVQHPIFLSPDQLAEILQPRPQPLPSTEYDVEDITATVPVGPDHLDELIEAELIDMFGHPPVRDTEGDIAIRVGSTMLFLRPSSDGREIVVFSTVVHEVEGRSRAVEVLNDLNADARWVKFQLIRDRVFVTLSVHAHPFVPAHLHQAVRTVSDVADGIDNELAAKLRGRTTFDDGGLEG